MKRNLIALLLLICQTLFVAAGDTVWDILVTDKRFESLVHAIEVKNLTKVFKDLQTETLFAPTNEAFNQQDLKPKLVTSKQILYHIATTSVKSNELWDGRLLDTEAYINEFQQKVKIFMNDKDIMVGLEQQQAKIIESNIKTSNGMIHAVDQVLTLPGYLDQTIYKLKEFDHYYQAYEKTDILQDLRDETNQGFTLFISKNDLLGDEFSSIEKRYLLDHPEGIKDLKRFLKHQMAPKVFFSPDFEEGKSTIETVDGTEELDIYVVNKKGAPSEITVNGIRLIQSDIIASNGVIHVLEKPLLPKHKQEFFKFTPRKALVGLNSTRLIELFDKCDLGYYLDTEKDITLLAPPNETIDEVGFYGKKQMKSWLQYHVIRGRYSPHDLQDNELLETESNDNLGTRFYQKLDVHITKDDENNKLIQFGKSGVIGDTVSIGEKMIIYPIAQPLELPQNPINQIAVKLELSTFVASLYATGSDHLVDSEQGITVFAPNNEAFHQLGLVGKYLLQPQFKDKLEKVVLFHAIQDVFYQQLMKKGEYHPTTLSSGEEIYLNKTEDGLFIRGHGAEDGNDRSVIGKVVESDMLTSNGVLHVVDRVQLPSSLHIMNQDLLMVEGTHSLLRLIQHTDLADKVLTESKRSYTILAPTDQAFNKFDLSNLMEDREKLTDLVKLHILPVELPNFDNLGYQESNYPTLFDNKVILYKQASGDYAVRIKDSSQESAQVINIGRSSAGGGVIMIDRVLVPEKEESHKLGWWAITLIVIGGIVSVASLGILSLIGWRWYKGQRQGYISLDRN